MGNLSMLHALSVGLVKNGVSIGVVVSLDSFHQVVERFFAFVTEAIYQTIYLPRPAASQFCSRNE
jgi:hypothetical protein